jgi:hypothetical protein
VKSVVPTLDHATPHPQNVEQGHGQDGISQQLVFEGIKTTRVLAANGSTGTDKDKPNIEEACNQQKDCHAELVAIECHDERILQSKRPSAKVQ